MYIGERGSPKREKVIAGGNFVNKDIIMVKAVFFDIDGTLVSFKTHEVPLSTVECLKALRSKGIKTFVSTGRMLGSINNFGDLQFD